jgi:hypothetical protein
VFTKPLERIGIAEIVSADQSVEVFRLPNGGYTTWWRIGSSVFEVSHRDLSALSDLVQGAIEFIQEDGDSNVA